MIVFVKWEDVKEFQLGIVDVVEFGKEESFLQRSDYLVNTGG
jgi:hypothetical protein